MPLSDALLVRYLVNATESSDPIFWRELQDGGHRAEIHGIRVDLKECAARAGSYLCLLLSSGAESVAIPEPRSSSVFGVRYESEEQSELADLMQTLGRLVRRQCDLRRERSAECRNRIRQEIFQQVMFGT